MTNQLKCPDCLQGMLRITHANDIRCGKCLSYWKYVKESVTK